MRISAWSSDVCSSDLITSLDAPHHPLPPPIVDQAFRDVRFRPVKAVEWSTRYIEVELRAVRGERRTVSVEYFDWRAARVRLFLDHDGRHQIGRASCRESVCQSV